MNLSQSRGFTLIELLIVSAISVILMVAVSSMFITSINTATRTHARQIIKAEGAAVMSQMGFFLRNAKGLTTCPASATSISVINMDGGTTVYKLSGSALASNSATMTSSSVTLSNLNFACTTDTVTGEKFVIISFRVTKGDQNEDFSSTVTLRNQ